MRRMTLNDELSGGVYRRKEHVPSMCSLGFYSSVITFTAVKVPHTHPSTKHSKPFSLLAGLAQPGKIERGARASGCRNHLHQLHVCLPAGPGRSRLLYRMSMDFLQWTKHVPFIQSFWAHIARQVSLLCCILVSLRKLPFLASNLFQAHLNLAGLSLQICRDPLLMAGGSPLACSNRPKFE
jgi:hypothetical protein